MSSFNHDKETELKKKIIRVLTVSDFRWKANQANAIIFRRHVIQNSDTELNDIADKGSQQNCK